MQASHRILVKILLFSILGFSLASINTVLYAAVWEQTITPRGIGFESTFPGSWVMISSQNTITCSTDTANVIYTQTRTPPNTNDVDWARWRPTIPSAGTYQVLVYIPQYTHGLNVTAQSRYIITHATGQNTVVVNQNNNLCGWVDLGTYQFNAGTNGNVYMGDYTGDNPKRLIAADGMKFVQVIPTPDTTPPNGSITTPIEGSQIGTNLSVNINATDNSGGSGVSRVECLVRYDGVVHLFATATSTPYSCSWTAPVGLTSQQIVFSINIIDIAGNRNNIAGGYRSVKFISEPPNQERAISLSKRFYLNQRSLSPKGDSMCGVASMAMLMASNGSITGDYATMKTVAEQMWSAGVQYPGARLVVSALNKRGYNAATPNSPNLLNDWATLKSEIDADRPVIINSRPGAMTPGGHYILAVGYKENTDPSQRMIYAYDPFGRHKDCYPATAAACSTGVKRWVFNAKDPGSAIGRWVMYPWAKLNPVIITAQLTSLAATNPSNIFEPELISDQPIGPEGDPDGGGFDVIFLPHIQQ